MHATVNEVSSHLYKRSVLKNIPQNEVARDLAFILKNEKRSLELRFSK